MKTHPPTSSPKTGSTLIMVLVVLLVVTGFSTMSLDNALNLARISQEKVIMEQAHYVAESGLAEAARVINTSPYMGGTVTNVSFTLANGKVAEITITPLNNRGNEFAVSSTSTINGVSREVNIGRVYRPTYLEYGHYYEDFRNLWWIYGNYIDGKVWTGTQQNIYGYTRSGGEKWGPVFGKMNQTAASQFGGYPEYAATLDADAAAATMTYDDLQFWSEYEDGYELETSKPDLFDVDFDQSRLIADTLQADLDAINPLQVDPSDMPKGQSLKFRGKTEMRFSVDTVRGVEVGIMEVRNQDAFGKYNWNRVYSEAIDMVYVENLTTGPSEHQGATLTLGDSATLEPNIVKGNMTIWAEDDVTIPTHIVYDNQNFEESTDKLGVISKDDIWFDRPIAGDLVVQGGVHRHWCQQYRRNRTARIQRARSA